MSSVVNTIISAISSSLATIIIKLIGLANEIVRFVFFCRKEKHDEKQKQDVNEYNGKVKDACDNGDVEDLLDL